MASIDTVTNFVVFGDSISDNGNFHDLAADFLSAGYSVPFQYDADGTVRSYSPTMFTDGTVYADTLAALLPLTGAYDNYALAGAEAVGQTLGARYITQYDALPYTLLSGGRGTFSIVDDPQTALAVYGDFDINLSAQVDRFLAAGAVEDGTLALLNIGGNDLSRFDFNWFEFIFLNQTQDFADDLADAIEGQARRLADAGVDTIGLFTLPVARLFVGFDDLSGLERDVADGLIDTVNAEILDRAADLSASGITTEVIRVDLMSIELESDAASYGFLANGPYLNGFGGDPVWVETEDGIEPRFSVNADVADLRPDQILFFDEVHPSGALHDLIAVFSHETLTSHDTYGSRGDNTLLTTGADDLILARDGADTVKARAGDDVILGGLGDDVLIGNVGSDLLIGGGGADSLLGGAGRDLLAGTLGDDTLKGGGGADILIGGLGIDELRGAKGNDVFVFVDDAFLGADSGTGTERYLGGQGFDTLHLFLTEASFDAVTDTGKTLSFGTTTLQVAGIEVIEYHIGLPGDADALGFSDDLASRWDEAQLWGVA